MFSSMDREDMDNPTFADVYVLKSHASALRWADKRIVRLFIFSYSVYTYMRMQYLRYRHLCSQHFFECYYYIKRCEDFLKNKIFNQK